MLDFLTLTGRRKKINYGKYKVNWEIEGRSKFQKRIKDFLRPYWDKYIICEEFPVSGTRLTFDFYNVNKKIAIEVQGQQHTKYVPFFHGVKNNFLNQLERDSDKLRFCRINNIQLIEIYPKDEPLTKEFFKKQGIELN
jgi:hypothetical protein